MSLPVSEEKQTMKLDYTKRLTAAAILCAGVVWMAGRLQAFNPQPDPPAFAAVQILPSETAKLFASCSAQAVRDVPPGPCAVALLFRDQQGNVVKSTPAPLVLMPGQTGVLELRGTDVGRSEAALIVTPEVRSNQGSRILPAVQSVDTLSGRTSLYSIPAAPRLSFFAIE